MSETVTKPKRKRPQTVAREQRKTLEIEERQKQVFELWKDGCSLREIGSKLGISHELARLDRDAELARHRTDDDAVRDQWRTVQLARLTEQYHRWNEVSKGSEGSEDDEETSTSKIKKNVEAGRLASRILDQITELTIGKAAQEIKHSGQTTLNVEIKHDLSKLTDEELSALKEINKKIAS